MSALTLNEIISRKPSKSRLTVIGFAYPHITTSGRKESMIECKCICGIVKDVKVRGFLYDTFSCGCLHKENVSKICRYRKISDYPAKLRMCYHNMMYRCYNKNNIAYNRYGGKGVIVCDDWYNSMDNFCEWALKNGWREDLQLDKDIKGNGFLYSPDSCCFVSSGDNNNSRSNIKKYLFNDELLTLRDISRSVNLSTTQIRNRMRQGFSFERAISQPIKK